MSSGRVQPRTRRASRAAGRLLLRAFPRVMGAATVGYAVMGTVLPAGDDRTAALCALSALGARAPRLR